MLRKLVKVYKRFYSFLFGQEVEHIHTREDRKKYYGRIRNEQETEARVILQYPKKGKFRFPVINDENRPSSLHVDLQKERVVKQEKPIKKQEPKKVLLASQKTVDNQNSFEKPKERKKFQGNNFKVQNIPSPIYAFQKPQSKSFVENSLEENVATIEIDLPLEIRQQEVFNLDKQQQLTQIDKELVQQEQAAIMIKEQKMQDEPIIFLEQKMEDEPITELEQIMEDEPITELGQMIEDEPIIGLEQIMEDELIITELEQPSEFEQSFAGEIATERVTDHDLTFLENEQPEPIMTNENKIMNERLNEERESHQKTVIPFNVLMLPKDRVTQKKLEKQKGYQFPTLYLLAIPERRSEDSNQWLEEKKQLLETTLENFHVQAKVVGITKGPSVTRFEIQPEAGVKVSKVTSLTDDIKLSLAASDIRIEAPIPGRNAIGIEVPNDVSYPVFIREILRSGEFQNNPSPLTVAMGLDITGKPIVTDIQKMPHGLIAGSTGSGKSVCINSILISIMFKATPDQVKLMLIDPKMVELAPYNDIPHLVTPVITDAKQATIALKWAVEEMERRYELFVQNGVRDIKRFNEVMKKDEDPTPAMPYIVIVIDELADLMMVSPQDVEESICRIAQKARACGIHLLVATQRPSVDVITGLIKANIPTRIAFSVSSQADSRTIIDSGGAERLLGRGDMLLFENGSSKPLRVQGNFVSDDEIDRVIDLVKQQRQPNYLFDKDHLVKSYESIDQEDDLFEEACYYVLEQGMASSSSLQRRFRIGFNRAARLIDMMEARGYISEAMGSKPRNVLVSEAELQDRK